ncbi:hypothetical protein ZWY2020_029147 [Hordeum vulgare]|nr:hypothetical protein ZWY2020_029147 [Hordeum vulgare]
MPHLHRLPVVLSIGTDRLPLSSSLLPPSSSSLAMERRAVGAMKSCKAWLLQAIPPELPHLHRLPVVLSRASIKSWCLLLGLRTTYSQLLDTVWQLVNYAKSVRVEKGDAVVIYLPMLMELPIAMLACSRIGPVHSVVFLASPPMQ